jgi:excisionase family DNA binding protein
VEKLLTVREVAERLHIAPGSVYHWLSARRLTCVRLSARCVRFREKDLEELVEQLSISSVSDGATRKKSR